MLRFESEGIHPETSVCARMSPMAQDETGEIGTGRSWELQSFSGP
jgi:hypothetical protein